MNNFALLQELLSYIEDHIEDEMTVETLAQEHYLSVSYLHKLFTSIVNYSPKEYIIKRRLTRAAEDLLMTTMRITDVAIKYNYQSYEGFSRAFKKFYSVSPKQFRKQNTWIMLFPKLEIEIVNYSKGEIVMALDKSQSDSFKKGNYILSLDIDNFTSYNTNYGYAGGDIIIAEAANRINRHLREDMQSQRVGGDEFIIITNTEDTKLIETVAQEIIEEARTPVEVKGQSVHFNMSIGIVRVIENQENEQVVIEQARDAMVQAKQQGRNCYKLIK